MGSNVVGIGAAMTSGEGQYGVTLRKPPLRPRHGWHADPTADSVLRKIVAEPDFSLSRSVLEDVPELVYAMALTPARLRYEYADALRALDESVTRGGMKRAIGEFMPFGLAFFLKSSAHDEVPRRDLQIVRERLDVEEPCEQEEHPDLEPPCAQMGNGSRGARHTSYEEMARVAAQVTLTTAEAARVLDLHEGTVSRWARDGTLRGVVKGPSGEYRLPVREVLALSRARERSRAG